jgi:hypothetical protein
VYLAAVLGAAGGLAASYLHHALLLDTLAGSLSTAVRLGNLLLLGLLVGGAIGFFPALTEGFGALSLYRVLRAGAIGAGCGAMGGLVSLPLAEVLHTVLGGGVVSRMIALALFGLAVGVAEGLNGGARWWRGLAGGAVGGAIAGLVLEAMLGFRGTHSAAGIVALMAIGVCVTLVIALFVNVLSDAWLEGVGGSSGAIYHLGKFIAPHEAIIGSAKKASVFIYLPGIAERYAGLSLTPAGTRLRALHPSARLLVNGSPVTECLL